MLTVERAGATDADRADAIADSVIEAVVPSRRRSLQGLRRFLVSLSPPFGRRIKGRVWARSSPLPNPLPGGEGTFGFSPLPLGGGLRGGFERRQALSLTLSQ